MVTKKDLKKRVTYVYPPLEVKTQWKVKAKKAGMSISKFVIEHVEASIGQAEENIQSRSHILEENRQLKDTLAEKEKRNHHLELLVDKLEEDLRLYRSKLFTDETYSEPRPYSKRLMNLLREPGTHNQDEILSRLQIKPTDTEVLKATSIQIENLEAYGIIRNTSKGWI